jgi:chromosome segregation ATPase
VIDNEKEMDIYKSKLTEF